MAYFLAGRAEQDVRDIYEYGLRTFGRRQADLYFEKLHDAFDLAASAPLLNRLRTYAGFEVRAQICLAHLIFYLINDGDIHIIRILHASVDWQSGKEW